MSQRDLQHTSGSNQLKCLIKFQKSLEIIAFYREKGMIANAIRTIVQASSYLNHEKRAVINIDSF